MTQYGVC